jgi:hypothetical protein
VRRVVASTIWNRWRTNHGKKPYHLTAGRNCQNFAQQLVRNVDGAIERKEDGSSSEGWALIGQGVYSPSEEDVNLKKFNASLMKAMNGLGPGSMVTSSVPSGVAGFAGFAAKLIAVLH